MALWENMQIQFLKVSFTLCWEHEGAPRTLPREIKKILLQQLTIGQDLEVQENNIY